MERLAVFAGTSNTALAQKVTEYLGVPMGAARVSRFPDGEILVKLEEDVRGRDVFIIQPTCQPTNDALMELLIFIDCARRASAERITAVVPYYGYARQDRKDEGRTPITAKLVANLITEAGANRMLTVDLHANQIQGFFDIPVDNLYAEPVLSQHFMEFGWEDLALVSPDVGNTKRARRYAQRLGGELAIVDKRRVSGEVVEHGRIIGDVKGKTVLMMDDMISTAGTLCSAALCCREAGAKEVFVGATHPVLCGRAIENLKNAPIDRIVVTDTVPVSDDKLGAIGKVTVLTISQMVGEAIHRIHSNESVSSLFHM
jgi:ribose-phosphate pyrophosphokinase